VAIAGRQERRGAEEGAVRGGVSPPMWGRGLGKGQCLLPRKFL